MRLPQTYHNPAGVSPVLFGCFVKFLFVFCLRRLRDQCAHVRKPQYHQVTQSGDGIRRVFCWQSHPVLYAPSEAATASRRGEFLSVQAFPELVVAGVKMTAFAQTVAQRAENMAFIADGKIALMFEREASWKITSISTRFGKSPWQARVACLITSRET